MKKTILSLGILSTFLFGLGLFNSCVKEIGPQINLTNGAGGLIDTTFTAPTDAPQAKNVLIEEFTGLACPNCPDGTILIDQLVADNPGKIVPVAYVQGDLAKETGELEDYSTDEGNAIADFLGHPGFWPIGAVDRDPFTSTILIGTGQWISRVNTDLALTSPVNINLSYTTVSPACLHVLADIRFTEPVTDTLRLTMEVVQSHIIDVQDSDAIVIPNYEHNHIVRDVLTSTQGDPLTSPTGSYESGRVFQKEYLVNIPSNWVMTDLSFVAIVHKNANLKKVVQVASKDVD